MGNDSSTVSTMEGAAGATGTSVSLPLPVRESDLFKHSATPYILSFLGDNPDIDVSIRQLARVTPLSERATREAVNALEANDLLEISQAGNARRVQINRDRLRKPHDPIRSIPQTEFQLPVRVAQHYIEEELSDIKGIVLFGSVARGDADRKSDIDLWVLVGDNHMEQRHAANKLARELGGLQIPPSIAVFDALDADFESGWGKIKEKLEADEQNWSSAQRHSFEIIVETPQSILNQNERVDVESLFGKGITMVSTDTLARVKTEVISDE